MSSGKSKRNRSRAPSSPSTGLLPFVTTTCAPSEPTTSNPSTSSAEDFPARISPTPAQEMDWRVSVLVFGSSSRGSFAIYDLGTWSSKTSQLSLLAESTLYSGDWPRSGMMRGGTAYALPTSARRTAGNGSSWSRGWWPTPLVHDAVRPQHGKMAGGFLPLSAAVRTEWPTPTASEHKATGYVSGNGEWTPSLRSAVRMEWPTPAAADGSGGRVSTQIDATGMRSDGRRSTVTLATAIRQEWPTPTVHGNTNRPYASKKSGTGLGTAVREWPTPQASANENRQTKPTPSQLNGTHGMNLATAANWQTPLTSDANGSKRGKNAQGSAPLSQQVNDWPTPLASDATHKKASAELMAEGGRPLVEQVSAMQGGPLNPDWVEQLMGFPRGFTDVGQLAPDKRNTSGKRRARRTASRTAKSG